MYYSNKLWGAIKTILIPKILTNKSFLLKKLKVFSKTVFLFKLERNLLLLLLFWLVSLHTLMMYGIQIRSICSGTSGKNS